MTGKGKLEGRNAIITGGGGGIGLAIAHRFAEEGATLFICDIRADYLEQSVAKLKQSGSKVITHVTDISNQESVQAMAQHALKELKQIDILVNNAGMTIRRPFLDYSFEEFDKVLKVNLYGVFLVTQAILPHMIARKKGKIVNMASTAGKWGSPNQSAYNVSKHGVIGLTRCIALEVAELGIHVNAICPSIVDETNLSKDGIERKVQALGISKDEARKDAVARIPMKRFIYPAEVANLALFLASDESNGITAQSIAIDGGYIMV
jgi:3-hydroxybutyrate dehydrogenase